MKSSAASCLRRICLPSLRDRPCATKNVCRSSNEVGRSTTAGLLSPTNNAHLLTKRVCHSSSGFLVASARRPTRMKRFRLVIFGLVCDVLANQFGAKSVHRCHLQARSGVLNSIRFVRWGELRASTNQFVAKPVGECMPAPGGVHQPGCVDSGRCTRPVHPR